MASLTQEGAERGVHAVPLKGVAPGDLAAAGNMMANADTPNARLQTAAQQNDVIGLERELADGA